MSGQHEESGATPDLTALAADLRRLSPREPGLDSSTLLFRAGQAAARRSWLWPAATAVSSLAALVLAAVLALQPAPQTVYSVLRVRIEPLAPPSALDTFTATEEAMAAAPGDLSPRRRLQEHLLRWGLEGLGQPPASEPAPRYSPDLFTHYSQLSSGEILP
jgi:hypothetical protein